MKRNFILLIITLILCVNSKTLIAADYYLQAGGSLTNLSNWGINTDGSGANPASFAGTDTWYITNNTSVSLTSSWGLGSGSTILIGDGASATTLLISTGGTITNNSTINMVIQDLATLDIQATFVFNIAATDPQTGSTIIFGTNAPDVEALSSSYYNLVIAANSQINSNAVTITGTLTINPGIVLSLNGFAITTAGIDCDGEIDGGASGNSGVTVNGDGGTIKFAPGGQRLSDFIVNLSAASNTLVLGSNLLVDLNTPVFNLTRGKLDISGVTFDNNGSTNFNSNGRLIGNSASTFSMGGSSLIIGSLRMETGAGTLGSLYMSRTGRTLTLASALEVTDLVTVSAGTLASAGFLTLNADATRAAAVAAMCSTCAITGNVTAENFLQASVWNGGWGLYGVNGINGQTIANLEPQVPMTCVNCPNSPSAVGNFTSIQAWDESACDYNTGLTTSTALTPGLGFWIYMATGFGFSADMNWSFTGTLAQGNVNASITSNIACGSSTVAGAQDDYNLLANPYASPISWDSFQTDASNSSSIDNTVHYFAQGAAATYMAGFGGTGTAQEIIPAGQGFFVVNSSFGPATLTFKESHKSITNTTLLWKGSSGKTSVNNHNAFRFHLNGPFDKDDALFRIKPGSSFEYNRKEDALKIFNTPGFGGAGSNNYTKYTSISSFDPVTGKYISINNFPSSDKRTVIPILVKVSVSGSYTLDASDYDNYQSCIVVRDKVTNIYTDLKLSPYVFTISDTTSVPRFELIVCENGGGGVSLNELYASENISIGRDAEGVVVKTDFDKSTDAVISVYNLLGQKLTDDIKVSGMQTTTHLNNLDGTNQVLIIKVTADNKSVTKKLLLE